jgi:hypothetical protein
MSDTSAEARRAGVSEGKILPVVNSADVCFCHLPPKAA